MKIKYKAFTIIEVLVAMWIITVAILGPFTVAISSSNTTRAAKDVVAAGYLVHEAFDLLRFTRDTLFLKCVSGDVANCTAISLPAPGTDFEKSNESAWRLFKSLLANAAGGGGAASCIVSVAFPDGCTYDIEGFLSPARLSPTLSPVIFAAGNASCLYLNRDDTKQNSSVVIPDTPTDGMYLCDSHAGLLTQTSFKRNVKVTTIPSIIPNVPGSYDELYNDDLRVEVEVVYSKINLLTKKVKIVDFIRSHS